MTAHFTSQRVPCNAQLDEKCNDEKLIKASTQRINQKSRERKHSEGAYRKVFHAVPRTGWKFYTDKAN